MVPVQLRNRIMELAHGSIMGGHMGIEKTADKIQGQSARYLRGRDLLLQVLRCISDACQETVI